MLQKESIVWTLALNPSSSPTTSAFGASINTSPRLNEGPSTDIGDLVSILSGKWDFHNKSIQLKETPHDDHGVPVEYEGRLARGPQGDFCLRGTWTQGAQWGQFACCREETSDAPHTTGLWLGRAEPAPELADFLIPTNPICWALSMVPLRLLAPLLPRAPAATPEQHAVFGAGFFDDAADVPEQPVLFFSLHGSWDAHTGDVVLHKRYARYAETEGYSVEYRGHLDRADDGDRAGDGGHWVRGTWSNPKGGSHGVFSCRRQVSTPQALTGHICICAVCSRPIQPGDVRWSCAQCFPAWQCCSGCYPGDEAQSHPHPLFPETIHELATAEGACCAEIALNALRRFADRPLIGLPYEGEDGVTALRWIGYSEVAESALDCAAGLRELRAAPPCETAFLAIVADASPGVVVAMLGGLLADWVLLPVHGALSSAELRHIFAQTRPQAYVVDTAYEAKVRTALPDGHASLWLNTPGLPTAGAGPRHGDASNSFATLLARGHAARDSDGPFTAHRRALDALAAVLYTSGSTGAPKGAMFSEELVMPSEGVATVQPFLRFDFQPFDPSFLLSLLQTLHCGGQRVLGRLGCLMGDLRLARPTHLGATPLFWNTLHREFAAQVAEERVRSPGTPTPDLESRVAQRQRAQLGNRLIVATSGGAPIHAGVLEYARTHLRLDIVDLYGSREAGGIARDGVVYKGVDVRLLPVEELGYSPADDPPTGEICVRSPRLISGYWNNEELNAESFVVLEGERYYRTGDIGELRTDGEHRRIRIIDRCSSHIKLAQGEWVAPAAIETVLELCPLVSQALVLGASNRPCTVAVVVPSPLLREFWSDPANPEAQRAAEAELLREIRFCCAHHHLRPIQTPQAVRVEPEHWTPANGALTPTEKKRRMVLTQRYRSTQATLYASLGECAALYASLGECAAPATCSDAPDGAFLRLLGRASPLAAVGYQGDAETTFAQLGGDSLSAARLLALLRSEVGLTLSVQELFAYPLAHIARLVHRQQSPVRLTPAAPSIAPRTEWHREWALPHDVIQLGEAAEAAEPGAEERSGVLVTGCTGFLGPALLHQILSQTEACPVFCILRAASPKDAAARISAALADAELWDPEWADRLVAMPGDLAQPSLGVDAESYARLVRQVGAIYHNAAWVNMALPYAALRTVNVSGTLEVLRLALRAGGAAIHHVSSVSALPRRPVGGEEESPLEGWVRLTADEVDAKAKDAYGQTKVVAERILLEAMERFPSLSIRAFRPSTIAGHAATGFSNRRDFGNLALQACAIQGVRPACATVRFSWIPVDLVARAIVALARCPATRGEAFNLTGEGPALATVLDLLEGALGRPLQALPNAEWQARMAELPDGCAAAPLRTQFARMKCDRAPAPVLPCAKARARMAALGEPWTEVTREAVQASLAWLARRGFFAAPDAPEHP